MDKLYLVDVIEKYHLGGLTERVKIVIKNKTFTTNFISIDKNLVGNIEAPNFDLTNCEFGIYDTTQLLRLIGITDSFITLDVEKKGKVVNKLFIADKEYNLEYILADTMLTPDVPSIDEPQYTIVANIDLEFISRFLKAKKALDTEVFTIEPTKDIDGKEAIKFTLGGTDGYTNKVSFTLITNELNILPGVIIKFPINEMGEILASNKEFSSGILRVNEDGLIKMEFENKQNVKSTYILVGKE